MLPYSPSFSPQARMWSRVAVAVIIGSLGAWLGIALWASSSASLGPVEARLEASVGPGRTKIELPPFGVISADSHLGPLTFSLSPSGLDLEGLGADLQTSSIPELTDDMESRVRSQLPGFAIRVVAAAMAGAFLLALIAFRTRLRWVVTSVVVSLVASGASVIVSARTFDAQAFEEPTFTGSLTLAPQLIGSAKHVASTIEDFRLELRRIVNGAVRAYTRVEPAALSETDEIRVLHISDVHLSPIGLDFARELATGFDVDLIIDTGDLTSYGTPFENQLVADVAKFRRPYLFVPGNHDSPGTESLVEDLPNASVLHGRVAHAAGLSIYGMGHPVYTEDATEGVDHPTFVERARGAGQRILADLRARQTPPDIVAVHDERMALDLAGRVPLVLSGHMHRFAARIEENTTFLQVGSTGGAGVNVFERSDGVPLSAQVLYFTRDDPTRLLAFDEIAQEPVTGRLEIDRHVVPTDDDVASAHGR